MITISVKQLMAAIEEAEVFSLPDMSAGADYIYNSLYRRLSSGEEVRLSEIDWSRFELGDVDVIRELHFDVMEVNEYRAAAMSRTLRDASPTTAAAAFV